MRWAMLLVCAVVLSGCGGGTGGGPFAGLPRYDAASEAARALTDAEADTSTSLAGRTLAVASMEEGRNRDGGEAWVVHLETLDSKPVSTCLFIWGREGFQRVDATYDVGPCPPSE